MAGSGQLAVVKRYEKKYLIPPALIPEIRNYIAPHVIRDKFGVGPLPEYQITTLQLDTPTFAFHRAKEEEFDQRFKLRVRTYNEIGSAPIFAEIKCKMQDIIVKKRVLIPFDKWNEKLLFSLDLPNIFKSRQQETDFLNFRRLVWETNALPSTIVRYVRESYVAPGDLYLRITFDKKLEYSPQPTWTSFGVGKKWRSMDSAESQGGEKSCAILEVKTLEEVPVWVVDMVMKYSLQFKGHCKYCTAKWRDTTFSNDVNPKNNIKDFFIWSV